MGTNYYLQTKPPCCPTCKRPYEDRHIGKSSAGWVFALHVYPEEGINIFADWINLLSQTETTIRDEYGRTVLLKDMLATMTRSGLRKSNTIYREYPKAFYEDNHAIPGPYGLLRSRIDGHCIGHGEGAYDYHVGEFS